MMESDKLTNIKDAIRDGKLVQAAGGINVAIEGGETVYRVNGVEVKREKTTE